MSVEGLQFRWRDTGTIAGVALDITAGDPVPALPLDQTTGLIVVSVAAAATVTLWQASASPITFFDYLYVMAGDYPDVDNLDGDGVTPSLVGRVELTCNDGANERIWFEPLRASFPYRRFTNIGLDVNGDASIVNLVRYVNNTDSAVTVRFLLARSPD